MGTAPSACLSAIRAAIKSLPLTPSWAQRLEQPVGADAGAAVGPQIGADGESHDRAPLARGHLVQVPCTPSPLWGPIGQGRGRRCVDVLLAERRVSRPAHRPRSREVAVNLNVKAARQALPWDQYGPGSSKKSRSEERTPPA